MSPHRRNLLLFVALLVFVRLALLLSGADVSGYGEEFAKGAAAKALLDGLPLPHYMLNYGYHEGGGFTVTHLKALVFLIIGPSVMAHKIVALGFCAATLLAGAWLLAENVSQRAAYVFAVLFTFAPETFQRVSLLNLGTHVEATLFIVLAFVFAMRLVARPEPMSGAAWWLGIGAGFGVYFSPQVLPALVVVAVAILARLRGRALVGVAWRGLAGFAIGAIPLWWTLAHIGLGGVLIHRNTGPKPDFLASVPGLVAPIVQSGDPLVWLQAVLFAAVIACGFMMRRSAFATLLVGYLVLYAVSYGMSGLAVPFDPNIPGAWFFLLRFVPPWVVVSLLAALGIDALWARGGAARGIALATALVAVIAGVIGFVRLASVGHSSTPFENLSVLARARGYSYQEYFVNLEKRFGANPAEKAAVLLLSKDDPALLVPDVANALYALHSANAPGDTEGKPIEQIVPELAPIFGEHRDLALLGLGLAMHVQWNHDIPAAFARLETLPQDAREPLAEALGREGVGYRIRADTMPKLLAVTVPEKWHDAWWRGVGWRIHQTYRLRPDLARATLDGLSASAAAPARAGYERALHLDRIE